MMHAHMRRLARDRGFDETAHGVPINQVDLARTWMDFTLTSLTAEERLGLRRARAAELVLPAIVVVVRRPQAWAAEIRRNRGVIRTSLSSDSAAR
jgi:hypothetical protein